MIYQPRLKSACVLTSLAALLCASTRLPAQAPAAQPRSTQAAHPAAAAARGPAPSNESARPAPHPKRHWSTRRFWDRTALVAFIAAVVTGIVVYLKTRVTPCGNCVVHP
jgi:hypothetical protein